MYRTIGVIQRTVVKLIFTAKIINVLHAGWVTMLAFFTPRMFFVYGSYVIQYSNRDILTFPPCTLKHPHYYSNTIYSVRNKGQKWSAVFLKIRHFVGF